MKRPTRSLMDPNAETQLPWIPSYSTNVSETFARIRREEANWKAFFDGLGEEMTDEKAQRDAMADYQSMQIKGDHQ